MVANDTGLFSLETLRAFGKVFVGFVAEPAFEVSKGVEVWHKLDAIFDAYLIDFLDFFSSQGRSLAPDGFVIAEGKGMLRVELQLIVA